MGERLGTIERLSTLGVDPISVDDALVAFNHLIEMGAVGTVAVTSRFGCPPDLNRGALDLPCLRFVDQPLVHYPTKEIVIETELVRGRDKYIDDHSLSGVQLFPGVMALEAMAQAATCLSGGAPISSVEDISFERAIHLQQGVDARIRLAALKTEKGIECALFLAEDNFRAPAARATLKCGSQEAGDSKIEGAREVTGDFDARPLYGRLFFSSGKFERLDRFLSLNARQIVASIVPAEDGQWFGSLEPQELILWDPGAIDACLHALQAAVPHRRVLPVAVERIELYSSEAPARVEGVEREARPGFYVFDLTVEDAAGRTIQRWSKASFKSVGDLDCTDILKRHAQLVAPFLERTAREKLGDDSIRLVLLNGQGSSRKKRREAAFALLDVSNRIDRRADGRPIHLSGIGSVTVSHGDDVTLAVLSDNPVGCDIEQRAAGDDLCGFVAQEALRKLGLRISLSRIQGLPRNDVVTLDEVRLLVLDVPNPLGFSTIAFTTRRDRSLIHERAC